MHNKNIGIQTDTLEEINMSDMLKKIKAAMKEKGCTQEDLANILLLNQSNISKYLSESEKGFFSVDKFFKICRYLGLSMDEITGLSKKGDESGDESLSDLCNAFCKLNNIEPFKTAEIELDGQKHTAVYYGYKQVSDMLQDISKINSISDNDTIFESWENGFKEKNNNRLKKYQFYTKDEFATHLLDYWISCIKETVEYEEANNPLGTHDYNATVIYRNANRNYDKAYSHFYESYGEDGLKLMHESIDLYLENKKFSLSNIARKSLDIFKKCYESCRSHLPSEKN